MRAVQTGALCLMLMGVACLGSMASWALGYLQGAAEAEETIAQAAAVTLQPPDPGEWTEEFEKLDRMAAEAHPNLETRERQWRVLHLLLAAHRYGVNPRLAMSVAIIESGFRQNAVSERGAVGIMQLLPSTARALSADPYNVAENIDAGVRYLAELLRRYHGDLRLALAAYNAGPTRVTRSVPQIREAQRYVRRIVKTYEIWDGR